MSGSRESRAPSAADDEVGAGACFAAWRAAPRTCPNAQGGYLPCLIAALLALLLVSSPTQAQRLPSPAQPSAPLPIERPPELRPTPTPIEIAPALPGRPPAEADRLRFELRSLEVEGATAVPEAELRALFATQLGTEVSVADVFAIADRITTLYRDKGYVLSSAVVPPQEISGGRVRLRVVEGYVSDVTVEGDLGQVRTLVESYLVRVTTIRPVRLADIERAMLLVNDLPGLSATSVLRPGAEVGSAQLVVTAQRKPFDGFASTNNRGSDFIGPWTSAAQVAASSFTPLGERLSVLVFNAWPIKEQQFVQGDATVHLGSGGLALHGFGSYGPSEPGSDLRDFDIDQFATRAGVDASYPLIRTRQLSLWVDGGYEYSLTRSESSGQKLFRDKIHAVSPAVRAELQDGLGGLSTFGLALRQGLPLPGYTRQGANDKSREDASGVFTAVHGEASRLQPLLPHLDLFVAGQGQYSPDDLLSDVQIKFGGTNFVRGYPPAELSGDSGLALSVELRLSEAPGWQLADFVQLYSFYEYGAVWNNGDDLNSSDWLSSAGVGVRYLPKRWLFFEVEFANGFQGQLSGDDQGEEPRKLYFTATASF